jgi:hypothetical protein
VAYDQGQGESSPPESTEDNGFAAGVLEPFFQAVCLHFQDAVAAFFPSLFRRRVQNG